MARCHVYQLTLVFSLGTQLGLLTGVLTGDLNLQISDFIGLLEHGDLWTVELCKL